MAELYLAGPRCLRLLTKLYRQDGIEKSDELFAFHKSYQIGSPEHKQLLKSLRKERIGRSAMRQAKRSSSFIFIDPKRIVKNLEDPLSALAGTKTMYHEIGHAFSKYAGLGKNEYYQRTKDVIANIKNTTGDVNSLFERSTLINDLGNVDEIPSLLDDFKTQHIAYMKNQALEEARAEGFSHQILSRTADPQNPGKTLMDRQFSMVKKASIKSKDEVIASRKTT